LHSPAGAFKTDCAAAAAAAGATSVADPLKLSRILNPQELLYTLLAVSHAPQPELLLSGVSPGNQWPAAFVTVQLLQSEREREIHARIATWQRLSQAFRQLRI
jgi:hypothetical protein